MTNQKNISFPEFKKLPKPQQKEYLTATLTHLSVNELSEKWGISSKTIYNWRYRLQIQKQATENKNQLTQPLDSVPLLQQSEPKEPQQTIPTDEHVLILENQQLKSEIGLLLSVFRHQEKQLDQLIQLLQEQSLSWKQEEQPSYYHECSHSSVSSTQQLTIQGEFASEEVQRRLKKVLLYVDEGTKYRLDVTLTELESPVHQTVETIPTNLATSLLRAETPQQSSPTFPSLETEDKPITTENLNSTESTEVLPIENLTKMDNSQFTEEKYNEGYNHLKSHIQGYHSPISEYENTPKSHNRSIVYENGIAKYQTYYICHCGDKNKRYIQPNEKTITCKQCSRRLKVREAHQDGFPNQDEYGNYFVSGKYKCTHEMEKGLKLG